MATLLASASPSLATLWLHWSLPETAIQQPRELRSEPHIMNFKVVSQVPQMIPTKVCSRDFAILNQSIINQVVVLVDEIDLAAAAKILICDLDRKILSC